MASLTCISDYNDLEQPVVLSHLSLLFVVDDLVSELVKEVGVPVKYPLMRHSIIIVLFHLFN